MIPYINQEYYDTLVELFRNLTGIDIGLEIGLGWATSAQAFLNSFPEAHLITVEQENYHKVFGPLRQQYKERVTIIQGRTPSIYSYLDYRLGEVDYIYIDAAHDYESCKADILGTIEHLKIGGVIAFDDYGLTGKTEEGKEFGVTKAVDEFIPSHWDVIFYKRNIKAFQRKEYK